MNNARYFYIILYLFLGNTEAFYLPESSKCAALYYQKPDLDTHMPQI